MRNITMKKLPIEERPYERLLADGASSLTNAELLAIILKTGTKEETVLQVAQNVLMLDNDNSLSNISKLDVKELMQVKGIGKVKAVQIKAVFELAKRIAKPTTRKVEKISNSEDVYNLLKYECINETKEKIFVISLNVKNHVLKISKVASGGNTKVSSNISEIMYEPIKLQASSIIVVHNHPSGDTNPSKADIEFTYKLCEASSILGISFLDHVIISQREYTSLKSRGII